MPLQWRQGGGNGQNISVKISFQVWKNGSQSRQDRSNYSAMASDLYSRYMPPKNTKKSLQDLSIRTPPVLRGASSLLQHTPPDHTSLQQLSPQQPLDYPTPLPSSSSPKRRHENDEHLLDDQRRPKKRKEKDDISRHKALLLKREKSVKKSEKLVSLLC